MMKIKYILMMIVLSLAVVLAGCKGPLAGKAVGTCQCPTNVGTPCGVPVPPVPGCSCPDTGKDGLACPGDQKCLKNSAGIWGCEIPPPPVVDTCQSCPIVASSPCGLPIAGLPFCPCADAGKWGTLCPSGQNCVANSLGITACTFPTPDFNFDARKAAPGTVILHDTALFRLPERLRTDSSEVGMTIEVDLDANRQTKILEGKRPDLNNKVPGDALFKGGSRGYRETPGIWTNLGSNAAGFVGGTPFNDKARTIAISDNVVVTVFTDAYFKGAGCSFSWFTNPVSATSFATLPGPSPGQDIKVFGLDATYCSLNIGDFDKKISSLRIAHVGDVDPASAATNNPISVDIYKDTDGNGIVDIHEPGKALLFTSTSFGGTHEPIEVYGDIPDLGQRGRLLALRGNTPKGLNAFEAGQPSTRTWDNKVQSVILRGSQTSLVLYENANYGGAKKWVKADTTDLGTFKNKASSIKVCTGFGCTTDGDNDQIPNKIDPTPCPSGKSLSNDICCSSGYVNTNGICTVQSSTTGGTRTTTRK